MNKDNRTYSARREYLIAAVTKKRKQLRQRAINHKGGKCELGGYSRCIEALEFHHRKDSLKNFGISRKGYTRSWIVVRAEIEKCMLACANCHREIHAGVAAFPRDRDWNFG